MWSASTATRSWARRPQPQSRATPRRPPPAARRPRTARPPRRPRPSRRPRSTPRRPSRRATGTRPEDMFDLDAEEQRVLGTLIEKQLATPQYYPLTLSALVAGCNQSTSRDPVTSYAESEVKETLARLR